MHAQLRDPIQVALPDWAVYGACSVITHPLGVSHLRTWVRMRMREKERERERERERGRERVLRKAVGEVACQVNNHR